MKRGAGQRESRAAGTAAAPRAQKALPDPFPSPLPRSPSAGFSLLELLVAMAVFAALAAAAYGGLAQIARTRGALAAQQDRFAAVTRAVAALERDLRQAVSRPVLGNGGREPVPALAGTSNAIELTRLGYANPRAEARSHLERVSYALDGDALQRARWLVLDRAADSVPVPARLLDRAGEFRLRYLGCDGAWREAWPPASVPDCAGAGIDRRDLLPRAVEFRFAPAGLGEVRRVVELPSTPPATRAGGTS